MRRRRRLRLALADRTGAAPADLAFLAGPWGKPRLAGAGPAFSVSHSGPHVLVVISDAWKLGCDLERLDPAFDWRAVAGADVFTAGERETLAHLSDGDANRLALEMWTIKEAVLKCVETGLSLPGAAVDTARGPPFPLPSATAVFAAPLDLGPDLVAAVAWRRR